MKSAQAKLQMRNLGTSMDSFDRAVMETKRTIPFPTTAKRKTIHTPQRRDHHPNRSSQGKNGPVKRKPKPSCRKKAKKKCLRHNYRHWWKKLIFQLNLVQYNVWYIWIFVENFVEKMLNQVLYWTICDVWKSRERKLLQHFTYQQIFRIKC